MALLRFLVALVSLSVAAMAQPRVSYIIPDVGTTRFATLIEIIGPHDAIGNFGVDGIYANNAGDLVRVVPERASDTAFVRFGPCVVSWNGRLISTHAFVSPYVQPNTHDYRLLDAAFKIPVRVIVANVPSTTVDTFYIVKPWPIGDVTASADRVFGSGSLGVRSPRGAMLIDSAMLGDTLPYTASMTDCDPNRAGNQAYLPFTLLATGNIDAQAGAMIRVDARGSDAGPGGGGGGGGYANALQPGTGGPQGSAGGNGFTGGGPGGRNNNSSESIWGPSSKRRAGDGSGQTYATASNDIVTGGASMNGVAGGESLQGIYENAGGGTGHPFGKSGQACDDFDGCSPRGQFGGGSGQRDRRRGGGGGFGEDGGADPSAPGTQGRAHGNSMLVPLAGGSGGASGNPSVPGEESMAGGGGGGAISIHAQRLTSFTVYSNGAAGTRNAGIGGGCGSGGGIIMGTRLDNAKAGFVSAQASGGDDGSIQSYGGYGRTRYDARTTVGSSSYVGPMTDTMTNALRKHLVTGSGNGQDEQIWIKPERGGWIKGPIGTGQPTWSALVDFIGTDTLYYVAVVQRVPSPVTSQHATDPQWVLSQSAWNIVRIYRPPLIQTASALVMGQYRCPNAVRRDTLWVYNRGESPLAVTDAQFTGAPGFRMGVPKVFPDTVPPFDSSAYIVEFVPQPGQFGAQASVLTLINNDPDGVRAATRVNISIDAQRIILEATFRGSVRDTVDLGTICAGTPITDVLRLRNTGTVGGIVTNVRSANPNVLHATSPLPALLNINTPTDITVVANACVIGDTVMPLLIDLDGCDEPDTLWLRFTGVLSRMTAVGSAQFGHVSVGTRPRTTIFLRNDGSHPVTYSSMPTLSAPFNIVQATPGLPATIQPGSSFVITVEFAPTATGEQAQTVAIVSAAAPSLCVDSTSLVVSGFGSSTPLQATPTSLSFYQTRRCGTGRDSVTVRNAGTAVVTIKYPAFINGPDEQAFTLVREPLDDLRLGPGDSFTYILEHRSTGLPYGPRYAQLSIQTDAADMPSLLVPISVTSNETTVSGPLSVDLGNISVGQQRTTTVTYGNASSRPVSISSVRSSDPALRVTPLQAIIPVSGTVQIDVSKVARRRGIVYDTLTFIYDTPCPDSFIVVVRSNGVLPSLVAPDVVRVRTTTSCDIGTDSITIVNMDTASATVADIGIVGRDAAAFTIPGLASFVGTTLQPRQSLTLPLRYDPRRLPDGYHDATVGVDVVRQRDTVSISTSLVGRRRTSLPAGPEEIAFGATDLLTPSRQRLAFVNRTGQAVTLTSVGMRGMAQDFVLRDVPTLPLTIPANGSMTCSVEFTARAETTYRDSVVLTFAQPCDAERVVPIWGRGRLDAEVYLLLPRVTVDPAADGFQLRLRGITARGASPVNGGRLRLTMRHRSSVFAVRTITPGTIIRNEVVGGIAELEIDVPNVRVGSDTSLITTITGDATLGIIDSSDVRAVDVRLEVADTLVSLRTYDGFINLDICREGGDRLLDRAGSLAIRATPNPATDDLQITVDVFESGHHTVNIVDVAGSVVATASWQHARGDAPFVLPIAAADLASGVYHIVLITPTRQRVAPLHIIH
ncbi:MAG: choice-of-anchor D domain-containing protein [Candidatus Kapabacteria bacterium]|nr:choice-of-anchor D domain-containing protein [Candidatus Kapabacteria bacterium]